MARYSPDMLAALRQRYEDTDQPLIALAADFGIGTRTLQTLVRKHGWAQRSQRVRDCPSAQMLLEEAQAIVADSQSGGSADMVAAAEATPALPLAGGGSPALPSGETVLPSAASSAPGVAVPTPLSPAERIEALVLKELEAEEAARAQLGLRPRARYDSERCARTLAVLTRTLKTLQGMGADAAAGRDVVEDAVPDDIDEFRMELARRIRSFVKSKIGAERYLMSRQVSALSDDELRELIALGRERGMEALLRPAAEETELADERSRFG